MIIAMDTPAVISLTFDDGLRCQFDKALPTLNSDGLPATFFLIANDEATHESWMGHAGDWFKIDWRDEDIGMLKKVVQDGHEIGSHSVTHHPQKMPMQPDIEARESSRLLKKYSTIETVCGTKRYARRRSSAEPCVQLFVTGGAGAERSSVACYPGYGGRSAGANVETV